MEKIIKLIENKVENEIVDFKLQFYSADKKSDMLKDILSFANNFRNVDKYIIFGFDNEQNQLMDVDYGCIEDVSNYYQLVSEYCDPYIDVNLEKFEYNGKKLAAVKILKTNNNAPYIVKKEFVRSGKILLRKGEIYVRKGANNFIADRDALDAIYENRKKAIIENEDSHILAVTLKKGNETKQMLSLKIKLINNTSSTLSFSKGIIKFKYESNCFQTEIENIEDYATNYRRELIPIKSKPLVLTRETQMLKSIIFTLSNQVLEFVKNKYIMNEKPMATIVLTDLQGKEYAVSFVINSFILE